MKASEVKQNTINLLKLELSYYEDVEGRATKQIYNDEYWLGVRKGIKDCIISICNHDVNNHDYQIIK